MYCAGQRMGLPENQYCCGDDVDCTDSRCTTGGFICFTDVDGDGISDPNDNCLVFANGPGTDHVPNPRENGSYQCDDDLDGFGNRCDCDFNQNGVCDDFDILMFGAAFGNPVDLDNAIFDLDCNGVIGLAEGGKWGRAICVRGSIAPLTLCHCQAIANLQLPESGERYKKKMEEFRGELFAENPTSLLVSHMEGQPRASDCVLPRFND